jgi:hypothetical protein
MSREAAWYFGVMVALFALLLIWLSAAPANAQSLCGPRRQVIDGVKANYSETEQWFGQQTGDQAAVMLLLASRVGTWTLLLVKPDVACIIGAGTNSSPQFGEPT